MKYLLLIFLLFSNFIFSQIETDSVRRIIFEVNFPANVSSVDEIDFAKEKPKGEFTLKGKTPLKYSFHLENDSIVSLYQFKNDEFKFIEKLNYQPIYWSFDNNELYSNFKIYDFDNDGDEDLVCWLFSNINGNEWTVVYLNDQTQQKLVKLYNTADDTDIWNKPEFNKKTHTINTELYGSPYGISEEGSYKLNNDLTITPLKKHFQDRTAEKMYDYFYVGQNGKWKLKSKKRVENWKTY
ncbi:hypothetical protein ACFSJW_24330 [Flavobacterium artemisiae]|uniref:VCBS repeat-containing protein n=1 Tax=Flavobacterium artemisiae TaxID=2126556 RepID=A0ABW4H994_9FLAO